MSTRRKQLWRKTERNIYITDRPYNGSCSHWYNLSYTASYGKISDRCTQWRGRFEPSHYGIIRIPLDRYNSLNIAVAAYLYVLYSDHKQIRCATSIFFTIAIYGAEKHAVVFKLINFTFKHTRCSNIEYNKIPYIFFNFLQFSLLYLPQTFSYWH